MPGINSLVLPLVLWDNIAPNCNISSMLINESETNIVTGTTSGHIIIWEFQIDDVASFFSKIFLNNKALLFRSHRYVY